MDSSQFKMKESSKSKKKEKTNKNKVSPERGSKSSMESPTPATLPDREIEARIGSFCNIHIIIATYICMYVRMHVCMYVRTYIHIYVCT